MGWWVLNPQGRPLGDVPVWEKKTASLSWMVFGPGWPLGGVVRL